MTTGNACTLYLELIFIEIMITCVTCLQMSTCTCILLLIHVR